MMGSQKSSGNFVRWNSLNFYSWHFALLMQHLWKRFLAVTVATMDRLGFSRNQDFPFECRIGQKSNNNPNIKISTMWVGGSRGTKIKINNMSISLSLFVDVRGLWFEPVRCVDPSSLIISLLDVIASSQGYELWTNLVDDENF